MLLDYMVAYLGLRTQQYFNEEKGNNIAEFYQPEECYEEVAKHFQRVFNLIKNNNCLVFSSIYDITH